MDVLAVLQRALETCARVIRVGAGIQENVRRDLVNDLQQICLRCEDALGTVLSRLQPVKDAYQSVPRLATELRAFAADTETRNAFKPERLCGEIDDLIVGLKSNLNPLKYSIDLGRLEEVHRNLGHVGEFDDAIYRSYDGFCQQLDSLATQLQDPSSFEYVEERRRYAQHVIEDFETDLRSTVAGVIKTKNSIVQAI
jgi:hypothetical protein